MLIDRDTFIDEPELRQSMTSVPLRLRELTTPPGEVPIAAPETAFAQILLFEILILSMYNPVDEEADPPPIPDPSRALVALIIESEMSILLKFPAPFPYPPPIPAPFFVLADI
jgi:hypothetical protein